MKPKQIIWFLLFVFVAFGGDVFAKRPQVLVFSKTASFRHSSIEVGLKTIRSLGELNGFEVKHSEDSRIFREDSLMRFDAIVFLNTTGDILTEPQQKVLKAFVRAGKGIVGVHAATDTEFEWPWYGALMGAYFTNHPPIQEASLIRIDSTHAAVSFLSPRWKHVDEWYNFRNVRPGLRVLIALDEQSYQGGENGDFHPIAWCQEFEGGRVFYTGLGHREETYALDWFRQHLLQGIVYALGAPDPVERR